MFKFIYFIIYYRFGDNIRVVNFGDCVTQINHYSSNRGNEREKLNSPMQPWNYRFNLVTVQLEDQPFEHAPVDNYSKFYLRCFIRRLWPHLSEVSKIVFTFYSQLILFFSFRQ